METREPQERVNPTWEAAMKTQGSIVINDPAWNQYDAVYNRY